MDISRRRRPAEGDSTEKKRMTRRGAGYLCVALHLVWVVTCVPVSDLLDRASQHSDQLHSLSTVLTHDLDSHFPPLGRMMMSRPPMCHTSSLPTPTDKDQALQVSESVLLSLARSLLQAWMEPLTVLSSSVRSLPHPAQSGMISTVQELQDHARTLGDGLDVLSRKLDPLVPVVSLPYRGGSSLGQDRLSKLTNFHFLLSCFRRDSHKIDSFLKVLRCRAVASQPQLC
ncbi:prolactin [Neosynchiropus ocellatus]